jgi:hypothetical protein
VVAGTGAFGVDFDGSLFAPLCGSDGFQMTVSFKGEWPQSRGNWRGRPRLTFMRCYALGANTRAAEVMQAFAEGVKGDFIREGDKYSGGDIAVWGLLRGASELRKKVKERGETYYAVDHAYIGREEYFRVTRNGFQQTVVVERPKDRWKMLTDRYRPEVKPWRRGGSYILLAMSSSSLYEHFDQVGWENTMRYYLRQYTDREVVTRRKALKDLPEQLNKAWAVVTHASMVAVDAVIAGVPVYLTGPSIAVPMGQTDLKKIEEPVFQTGSRGFGLTPSYAERDV